MSGAVWRKWQVILLGLKFVNLEILSTSFIDFLYDKLEELSQDLWALKGWGDLWSHQWSFQFILKLGSTRDWNTPTRSCLMFIVWRFDESFLHNNELEILWHCFLCGSHAKFANFHYSKAGNVCIQKDPFASILCIQNEKYCVLDAMTRSGYNTALPLCVRD